jgi:hypothetical protein
MKRLSLVRILAALCFLSCCGGTLAAVITFNPSKLTATRWLLEYRIEAGPPFQEFSIYFDRLRYSNLSVEGAPADWDAIVLQPDASLQSDGIFDALALDGGLSQAQTITGFRVSFDLADGLAPAAQRFEVFDPLTFSVLESGRTLPLNGPAVPEPDTLLLCLGGLLALLLNSGRRRLAAILACAVPLLSGCGAGDGQDAGAAPRKQMHAIAAQPSPDIRVEGLVKVSESRISRTVYEYVFRVRVRGDSKPYTNVSVRLVSAGTGTTLVEDQVMVGDLAAGAIVTPADTVTIRHDRTVPFSETALQWQASGTPVEVPPSDPVAGSDADGDGVRDDVQTYILSTHGTRPAVRDGLLQLARGLQSSALAASEADRDSAATARAEAAVCLSDRTDPKQAASLIREVKVVQFSNESRLRAEIDFNRAISGKARKWVPSALEGTCK